MAPAAGRPLVGHNQWNVPLEYKCLLVLSARLSNTAGGSAELGQLLRSALQLERLDLRILSAGTGPALLSDSLLQGLSQLQRLQQLRLRNCQVQVGQPPPLHGCVCAATSSC